MTSFEKNRKPFASEDPGWFLEIGCSNLVLKNFAAAYISVRGKKIMAYEDNINHQLIMLDITWEAFKANGVTDEIELVLEFVYLAPNKKSANLLNAALNIYDSSVRTERLFKKKWYVEGKSYPIAVSKDALSQWLNFMVSLGWEHDCEFDRFSASMT